MKQNSFFIYLSSEDSLSFHEDSVAANFIVEPKEIIQLFGLWEVVICNFDCTYTLSQKCYIFSDIVYYS